MSVEGNRRKLAKFESPPPEAESLDPPYRDQEAGGMQVSGERCIAPSCRIVDAAFIDEYVRSLASQRGLENSETEQLKRFVNQFFEGMSKRMSEGDSIRLDALLPSNRTHQPVTLTRNKHELTLSFELEGDRE
jgi:hypothetical protein